eukprot:TRINITY_DN7334_c0_g1_i3.p1 TRINITY_DN7334_c0_g1~~TRINITY_DN7334_c0_g1_i3.p1  ORF type:complete len:309 (+),score=120.34 TRINITY_DN7334_c0_g1_i3:252-1178(+)
MVVYYRPESVDLAIAMLDGAEIEPGYPIHVEDAEYNKSKDKHSTPAAETATTTSATATTETAATAATPATTTTTTAGANGGGAGGNAAGGGRGQNKRQPGAKKGGKRKAKKIDQAALLGWADWETRQHIILKGMFDPAEAEGDPNYYKDLKEEIKEEAETCGPVQLIKVFENNPEGVVAIKFQEGDDAKKCIDKMNGRWFAKRQIRADWYDGVTDYVVKASKQQEKARIQSWEEWLGSDDSGSSDDDNEEEEEEEGKQDGSEKSKKPKGKEQAQAQAQDEEQEESSDKKGAAPEANVHRPTKRPRKQL